MRYMTLMLRIRQFWVALLRTRGFKVITRLIKTVGQCIGQSSEGATEQALIRRVGELVRPACW